MYGLSISDEELAKCICPCIKPEKISECACPTCTDIECEVRALRDAMGCDACQDGPWATSLSSINSFERAISCADEEFPCMERAESSEPFKIRPLRCCVKPGEVPDVEPSSRCTLASKLPHGACSCFSDKSLDRKWTWLKRQETIEGKNNYKITIRLRTYEGTVRELNASVMKSAPQMACVVSRRQFHLDCDNFLGLCEAVLIADFFTAMVLGSGYKSTCETDATSTLYVVLVLYKKNGNEVQLRALLGISRH